LNKGDWCSNKGANQARVMFNNKVLMSPTWARPIGYQWEWSQMIKHIWLTKLRNFEHVPSNLSSRLIHGSFGWVMLSKHIPKRLKFDWFANEPQIHESVWFSCSRFLRTTTISSMHVNMIMNTMKNDTNKRWVIHNLNQQ
jgi:hypothetical protein